MNLSPNPMPLERGIRYSYGNTYGGEPDGVIEFANLEELTAWVVEHTIKQFIPATETEPEHIIQTLSVNGQTYTLYQLELFDRTPAKLYSTRPLVRADRD